MREVNCSWWFRVNYCAHLMVIPSCRKQIVIFAWCFTFVHGFFNLAFRSCWTTTPICFYHYCSEVQFGINHYAYEILGFTNKKFKACILQIFWAVFPVANSSLEYYPSHYKSIVPKMICAGTFLGQASIWLQNVRTNPWGWQLGGLPTASIIWYLRAVACVSLSWTSEKDKFYAKIINLDNVKNIAVP